MHPTHTTHTPHLDHDGWRIQLQNMSGSLAHVKVKIEERKLPLLNSTSPDSCDVWSHCFDRWLRCLTPHILAASSRLPFHHSRPTFTPPPLLGTQDKHSTHSSFSSFFATIFTPLATLFTPTLHPDLHLQPPSYKHYLTSSASALRGNQASTVEGKGELMGLPQGPL